MPHIHELIDFTASAFIVFEEKVLLVHHKKLNTWLQVGGHIELDQDPDQALLAEIREECGLDVEVLAERAPATATERIKPLWRPHFVNIHRVNETHRHCDLGYVCRAKTDQVILAPDEHNDIRWFSREEISNHDDMLRDVKELCLAALDIAAEAR